jgi:hypothetical protein
MQLERIRSYRLNIFNQGRRKQVPLPPPQYFILWGAGIAFDFLPKQKSSDLKK